MAKGDRLLKKLVTPIGRFNWVYVAEPYKNKEDPTAVPKHKITLMVPKDEWEKSDEAKALKKAVLQEYRSFFGKPKAKLGEFKHPFNDGDDREEPGDYAGQVYMTMSTKDQPKVKGAAKDDIYSQEKIATIKAGDYGRCAVLVWGYDKIGKGVTLLLEVVQHTKVGDPIAAGADKSASLALLGDVEVTLDDIDDDDAIEVAATPSSDSDDDDMELDL